MKYPQNNKQKKWHEKAQGIVEYALILAFVVGIAAAIFAKGGLAEAVSDAYFRYPRPLPMHWITRQQATRDLLRAS
ncbi:hypothetical protein [Mitsuokella jalaludinii]|uniref:hypothetical protein n=1 Tax=Mitsuokella jalaludinii TaxID=187979 RepID=UPI0030792641